MMGCRMMKSKLLKKCGEFIDCEEIYKIIAEEVADHAGECSRDRMQRRVLIIPPDYTRCYSMAGIITQALYREYEKIGVMADVLPAVGTHMQMSGEEKEKMFGDIPAERFLTHDWKKDCVTVGTVPKEYVEAVSEGIMSEEIPVTLDEKIVNRGYWKIYSVGQVVPHEVVGMANHAKNLFVGCGGREFINATHILGAVYGMEKIIGKSETPPRKLFDYAADLVKELPLTYIQTVVGMEDGEAELKGIFISEGRKAFEEAAMLAEKVNIIHTPKRYKKVVARLDENEFKSTWVGNKAVYRTRMMVDDGGELIILAPGVEMFGENEETDTQIRRYGYKGRDYVLRAMNKNNDLSRMSAAHLIHGSSDGRFKITYCTEKLSKEEIEGVGYAWMSVNEAESLYSGLKEGVNEKNGEEIYFVGAPAMGLWACKE